jgi:hypothetical protein
LDLVNATWLWNGESLIRIDKLSGNSGEGVTLLKEVTGFKVFLITPAYPDQPMVSGVTTRWPTSPNPLGLLFRIEGSVDAEKAILIGRGD